MHHRLAGRFDELMPLLRHRRRQRLLHDLYSALFGFLMIAATIALVG